MPRLAVAPYHTGVRLIRAIWGTLAFALLLAGGVTWWLTRPLPPERPWVGAVTVIAGEGRDGWRDGPVDTARFSEPFGVAVSADGTIHVSDAGWSHRIRRITPSGTVTTVAGGERGFADGRGAAARFATPSAMAVAPDGSIVVADTGNHAIRRVAPDGSVTTVAGDGTAGYIDGSARHARFNAPVGVAVDAAGRIIVADTYNDRIRVIDPDGLVRTIAGGDDGSGTAPQSAGYIDGPGPDARFDTPCGVAVDAQGRVLVADTGNGLIRLIGTDGTVSTLPLASGMVERPMGVAVSAGGEIIVVDEAARVVAWAAPGEPRLLAGGRAGFADGVASDAQFRRPSAIALLPGIDDQPTRLVVADAGNAMVRLVRGTVDDRPAATGDPRGPNPRLQPRAPGVTRARRYSWPWTEVAFAPPPPPRVTPSFDAEAFARAPLLWPVAPLDGPHEVAGTFGETRGEAGLTRLHAGLDVREVQGTLVRAVRDGIVASPMAAFAFDTLNEGVRIGDVAYIHIRVGRTRSQSLPRSARATRTSSGPPVAPDVDRQRFAPVYDADGTMVRMRAMRGAHFSTGDMVGSVNAFNHVHLNVGWPGEEHNPLAFRLVRFVDSRPPTIEAGGIRLFDEAWHPLNPDRVAPAPRRGRRPTRLPPLEPAVVRGKVRIVVDAWDQADGNVASRRLGLYSLGYQVLMADGRPAPGFEEPLMTQQFDRMPIDREAARQLFADGSGIPAYGARRTRFLYVVTTAYRHGAVSPGWLDTTTLAPGAYVVRAVAEDASGNQTTRDLRISVAP